MDMLQAPFKKVDEYMVFKKALEHLKAKDPQYITTLLGSLSEQERKFLKEHI